MYYVNKIIGWALSPYGIFYLGLLVAWLLRRSWPRCSKAFVVASLSLFWLLGLGVTTLPLGVPLESEFVHAGHPCGAIEEPLPDVELIVLLGGSTVAHEKCGAAELLQSADRVREAALLWKAYKAAGIEKKIFCTGGGVANGTVPFLMDLGVPREVIDFSEKPRITAEEAALIKGMGVSRIALVTSAWHMKRARKLFQREGLDVTPVATDFESTCL